MNTAVTGTVIACVLTLSLAGCDNGTEPKKSTDATTSSAVVVLTDANFDTQIGHGVVLVDFWATWCGPCRMQGPIVEQVAEQLKGKVVVGKLDVDAAQNVARKFGIESIPTLILFKDGKLVQQFVGVTQAEPLVAAITSAIGTEAQTRK